jgi:S1-C subfamily serine protease
MEVVGVTEPIRGEQGIRSQAGALVVEISTDLRSVLGLVQGDVIIGVNNRRIQGVQDLTALLGQIPPGARAYLTFERNGEFGEQPFIMGR